MDLDRSSMAREIGRRLDEQCQQLVNDWKCSAPINYFVIDDVLPDQWAHLIREAFPSGDRMVRKSSLRELKYVAAQMNDYHPLLEESIYAFQMPEIVSRVEEITGLRALE